MSGSDFTFVPYRSRAYDYVRFSSGNRELDTWLREHGGQNQRLNRARTFLLVRTDPSSREVIGYFSLVNFQIGPKDAEQILKRDYRYPMPATLLTRLAVSRDRQGEGFGGVLLEQAMRHALLSLEFSASEMFVVDAADQNAIEFYKRHGLELLHEEGRRLIIPTLSIAHLS
ncbi:MAG: GNAT family N-acetyltransferase [Scrofimicrobium sp.]